MTFPSTVRGEVAVFDLLSHFEQFMGAPFGVSREARLSVTPQRICLLGLRLARSNELWPKSSDDVVFNGYNREAAFDGLMEVRKKLGTIVVPE